MRALFVVEKDFLSKHVGVARVILHYYEGLLTEGVLVDFGYPHEDGIIRGKLLLNSLEDESSFILNAPFPPPWYSTKGRNSTSTPEMTGSTNRYSISWLKEKANPEEYDLNLLTAPWVCAPRLPPLPNVVGIVYDLVPNLAVSGCLRLNNWSGLVEFAHDHDIGFRYYLANAEHIIFISEATRQDFLKMYESASHMKDYLWVDIPYIQDLSIKAEININTISKGEEGLSNVLLVNALDWRKNLESIQAALKLASQNNHFNLLVVGKERIPMPEVESFFASLEESGIRIQWWRHAGDDVLNACYAVASVLLFPSLYEGLGLPILEAQSFGTPVITSNISSCPEINLNPNLCLDPRDIDGMVNSLGKCLGRDETVVSGKALQRLVSEQFSDRKSYKNLLIPRVF